MTVMDPRPWSPAGPHIGPDEEDLAMLDPSGDAETDLGSAVLAVHRVGAAACEAVARAPLPDEYRLIDALATARTGLAQPVVDAVSKCVVSANPTSYADLLLRDLLDAGEEGSVAVYRACVAKGVAPPLAVQRAGLVFGVPHGDLGRYLSVAADPRAHPVAIADAADRAVAKWASGVVREELAEPVSKAVHQTEQQYNATPFGQVHPKGQAGQFVATLERGSASVSPAQVAGRPAGLLARMRRESGVGNQAAPDVAVEPGTRVIAPPTEAPRPVRRVRRTRAVRRVRQEGAKAVATPKLKAQLRSGLTARLAPKTKARLDAQRFKATGQAPLVEVHFDDESAISRAFTQRLDTMLAWSMSIQDANEIFRDAPGAGTFDKPKHQQMGALQQRLAEPIPWGPQHEHQMKTIAENAAGDEQPRFIRMDADELEGAGIYPHGDPAVMSAEVEEYAKMTGYYDQLARDPDGTANPMLKAVMQPVPSADGTGDWFLVVNPESVVYSRPENAPLAASAEFVVSDPAGNIARVNKEGSPDYPYYELDPTQHWIIKEPVTLWRQTGMETGHWVDRYTVEPLDDWDSGKAIATQQAWRTEPRNAQGEWSRTSGGLLARIRTEESAQVTPVVTPIAPRSHRKVRAHRKVRQPAPASAQQDAKIDAKVGAKLPARLLSAFHRGLLEGAPDEVIDTSMPAWDDRDRYVVYQGYSSDKEDLDTSWDVLLRQNNINGFRNEVVPTIPLTSAAKEHFLSRMRDAVDGTRADTEVRLHVENEIMERHQDDRREVKALAFHVDEANEAGTRQWEMVGRRVRNMMALDQSVQSVRIDPGPRPGDYRVMVNAQPVSDVIVVILPDDFDPDRPVTLKYSGRTRQSALNRNIDRHYDEALHIDAPVQMFRATQGTKQIWHARQDEQ